jgi:hypothetical protein
MNVVNGTVYDTDSSVIKGTVSGTGSVKGGVSTLYAKDGASAYEIAREKGFRGTEEEWLASLKGDKGDSGVYIGSGDMPEDSNVQIDPNGDTFGIGEVLTCKEQTFTEEEKRTARANIGAISLDDVPYPLPEVTDTDNGKFLRVADGVWSAVTVDSAEGVSF